MFNFFGKNKKDGSRPAVDPVCGMKAADTITASYQGRTYSFCSEHCKQEFERDPKSYVD